MKRTIITFGGYFENFIANLSDEEVNKIDYILALLSSGNRISIKFIKHIQDGLYELRAMYNHNIFRVFFCFDEDKIVVLFNGFQKKSQKTPPNEISKALKIKKEYYETKHTNREL
jgi:phage-related protein